MKKVLFLQLHSDSFGGIWFVNKSLGEKFIELGFDVKMIGIRQHHPFIDIGNTKIKIETINEVDDWTITHKSDVLHSIKKLKFFTTLRNYLKENKKLKKDYKILKSKIIEYAPDYIIVSHYQLLSGIPKSYLTKTINVQHSSFEFLLKFKSNVKALKKYQNKVKLCWLSKSILKQAIEYGFKNNVCIYNPVRFNCDKKANVTKNKKITVISRISSEKRIDLMVEMVNEVLSKVKDETWLFEIYGAGAAFKDKTNEIIKNNKQIEYKGKTEDAKKVLLSSSITLNTSIFEGYPLSIIEGYSCGVPAISFEFGPSAKELIIENYNGFLIEMDNLSQFKNKLIELMNNEEKLEKMSQNAFLFSKNYDINQVILKWLDLFKKMDEGEL